jgi:hypothetical protein
LRTGVHRIADDRMTEVFEMNADLMRAAGAQEETDE